MEATKRCPFCAEEILAAAVKCRFCQSDLSGSAPSQSFSSAPRVATCRKCNIALIPELRRKFVSTAGCFGALLFLIGLICCITIVGLPIGLAFMALGVVVSAVGGKKTVMICPSCGGRDMLLPDLIESEPESWIRRLTVLIVVGGVAFLIWLISSDH